MTDIHAKQFDGATQVKLQILKEYLREWLPVFLKRKEKYWKEIYIYDFFAGEGYDTSKNPGSPIIIIQELLEYHKDIIEENISLKVVFNDIDNKKILKLKENINNEKPFQIDYLNEDFTKLFNRKYPEMIKNNRFRLPRFMFIDQYGVKYVTKDIFNKLADLKRTDFLFFISSHFVKRFSELQEFKKYIQVTKQDFDNTRPYQCHRVVFEYFRNMIPKDKELYLAPFSLRKDGGSNVYGLIFGSHHLLGIEKFLNLVWKQDGIAGEANFNIDGAILEGLTFDLFNEDTRPKKLQLFERDLQNEIKSKKIVDLKSVYRFTLNYGCLAKHANDVLEKMKKEKIIKSSLRLKKVNIHKLEDNILLQ